MSKKRDKIGQGGLEPAKHHEAKSESSAERKFEGPGQRESAQHKGKPDPPKGGPNAQDLDALQRSINDSASQSVVTWSSFTLFGLYLSIATGAVTHRDLFLDHPIKLPVLNVDLPVRGFFAIAPGVYLIFHAYLLLQLVHLSLKLTAWSGELTKNGGTRDDHSLYRLRFNDFPILQYLAADRTGERANLSLLILLCISWITLTFVPIVLLLQMQVAFLPDHIGPITWLQRFSIAVELSFAWIFWWSLGADRGRRWRDFVLRTVAAASTLVVLIFSFAFATFPNEAFATNWVEQGVNWTASLAVSGNDRPVSLVLFGGDVNEATGGTTSLFTNRLILPGEKFYDGDGKVGTPSVSLRGRDLSNAVLQNADLRFADFRGADLSGADLYQAQLDGARFDCPGKIVLRQVADQVPKTTGEAEVNEFGEAVVTPKRHLPPGQKEFAEYVPTDPESCKGLLVGADLAGITAPRASFQYADLRYAKLIKANLRESAFAGADLRNANLADAQAPGATFAQAQMQGVDISDAALWGANFTRASMQGAHGDRAFLDGSIFTGAHLEGASFGEASMNSAKMNQMQAQGVRFNSADLGAAILIGTQFQGADLTEAKLDLANFRGANQYRARADGATGRPMVPKIDLSDTYPLLRPYQRPAGYDERSEPSRLDANGYSLLRARAILGVLDEETRKLILRRLATLDPANRLPDEDPAVLAWNKLLSTRDIGKLTQRRRVAYIERMCSAEGAPYVARFLIKEFTKFHGFAKAMAEKVKDIANCPGAKGLTDEDLLPLAGYMAATPASGSSPKPN